MCQQSETRSAPLELKIYMQSHIESLGRFILEVELKLVCNAPTRSLRTDTLFSYRALAVLLTSNITGVGGRSTEAEGQW
jgi:hypothetical protein